MAGYCALHPHAPFRILGPGQLLADSAMHYSRLPSPLSELVEGGLADGRKARYPDVPPLYRLLVLVRLESSAREWWARSRQVSYEPLPDLLLWALG